MNTISILLPRPQVLSAAGDAVGRPPLLLGPVEETQRPHSHGAAVRRTATAITTT